MHMRSGLKVTLACMSQDGEGVLSIKFNVIINIESLLTRSLVLESDGGNVPLNSSSSEVAKTQVSANGGTECMRALSPKYTSWCLYYSQVLD